MKTPMMLFLSLLAAAPWVLGQNPPPDDRPPAGKTGGPLAGLTSSELEQFRDGLDVFRQRETPESGLGPVFNDVSCIACHRDPFVGGSSPRTVIRFGRTSGGHFDPLTKLDGSLHHARAIDPSFHESLPPEANTFAQRISPALYGDGLIDAIPDASLVAAASAPKADGVHGRAAIVMDVTTGAKHVGRFGGKAQQATLLAFSADAFVNEIGITNRFYPKENAPSGNAALLAKTDKVPDPEDRVDPATGKGDIDRATDFMRLLAPPTRGTVTPAVLSGERLFTAINCTACHSPAYTTGPNPVAALSHKPVPLYSDLLLHDMGKLGDGIAQAAAGPRDMRTAPLWGIRLRSHYLHDGRTDSLDKAIRAHDGEAAAARARYLQLPAAGQQQLVAFLLSL